jgi:3'(2'), 5'-bisphosphate nucleotidase
VGESHALCARLGIDIAHVENSALKFGRLAEGEVDCYPRPGRTMQWDVGAGDALLRALGGGVFTLEGARLSYGAGALGWANPAFIAWRDTRDVRAIRGPDSA